MYQMTVQQTRAGAMPSEQPHSSDKICQEAERRAPNEKISRESRSGRNKTDLEGDGLASESLHEDLVIIHKCQGKGRGNITMSS
jgi:hypothetical protein